MFNEAGAEDSRRNGNHADAQNGDDGTKEPSKGGDGVDVAIADGGKGSDRPPKAGKGVGELVGLCVVFGMVHEERGKEHQKADENARRHKLTRFFAKDFADGRYGFHVAVEFEDSQEADEANRSESK